MQNDFLIEIGTEELPPTSLRSLASTFCSEIASELSNAGFTFDATKWYATPRRLAVLVSHLSDQTPAREETLWGPPVSIAFDVNGKPSRAAMAFADKNQLDLHSLRTHIANDGKADRLCLRHTVPGKPLKAEIAVLIETALGKLPIAKRMRWGSSRQEFVRPIQWMVLLYGEKPLNISFFQETGALASFSSPITSNNTTRGHRFHANHFIAIPHASKYAETLTQQGYVIADFELRREMIATAVSQLAQSIGATAVIDPDLLDEVTALVEFPVALLGNFETRFLEIPSEALISSMKEHQKYFHLLDADGRLMAAFITVSNIQSKDPAAIIAGNERVIRPRLSDAAFFYRTDLAKRLESQLPKLESIVFQAKLGSLGDKVRRLERLAGFIASELGFSETDARRAAHLSKCDLVSEMVMEFDTLQGTMGRYYALHDGERTDVATALEEQYLPRFAGDRLPQSNPGIALALADRLDTLAGIFGIGEPPTGSRDPFALRRASLGILRILVESNLNISLIRLIEHAVDGFNSLLIPKEILIPQLHSYILDRLSSWFEGEAISPLVFPAVRACEQENVLDIHHRVMAVSHFLQLEEAVALTAANKRVANLLSKTTELLPPLNPALFTEVSEKSLFKAIERVEIEISPVLQDKDYRAALISMATLRSPLDRFFEEVLVMCDDPAVRENRLALLSKVRHLFLQVADISLLVVS